MTHILDHGAELVKSLTDAELSAAINSARLACRAAWAAHKVSHPYCRDPFTCMGKGYCPKEFACND